MARNQRMRARVFGPDAAPSRAATDQTPRHLPHFEYRGLWFDGQHRLWVIGSTSDSTFLDVFQDSVYLGRRMIACHRTDEHHPVVQGRWLAVICDGTTDDQPYVVRLFRIVEPGGHS